MGVRGRGAGDGGGIKVKKHLQEKVNYAGEARRSLSGDLYAAIGLPAHVAAS